MKPRQACLACLEREPVDLLEAALWIAAEHDPGVAVSYTHLTLPTTPYV